MKKPGLFRVIVHLPKEKSNNDSAYLKLTSIWLEKTGKSISYKPMVPRWDVTGIVRETIFLKDALGNNTVLREELSCFEDLNGEISWSVHLNTT